MAGLAATGFLTIVVLGAHDGPSPVALAAVVGVALAITLPGFYLAWRYLRSRVEVRRGDLVVFDGERRRRRLSRADIASAETLTGLFSTPLLRLRSGEVYMVHGLACWTTEAAWQRVRALRG